jgi:hypothetical protein
MDISPYRSLSSPIHLPGHFSEPPPIVNFFEELPAELVDDILAKLPLETFMQLLYVSKTMSIMIQTQSRYQNDPIRLNYLKQKLSYYYVKTLKPIVPAKLDCLKDLKDQLSIFEQIQFNKTNIAIPNQFVPQKLTKTDYLQIIESLSLIERLSLPIESRRITPETMQAILAPRRSIGLTIICAGILLMAAWLIAQKSHPD